MNILVTGGAGFIGSNLVESLLENKEVKLVRVFDNLSTGHLSNLKEFRTHSKFEFFEGDVRSTEDCTKACEDINAISHQAGLGSVPRSINDPLSTHNVNVNGFINLLESARAQNIKRIVYASSSSVYGDLNESPKKENKVGKVLSPYAASKMTTELYAEAFARNYNMTMVGLRYFNVFGPKQDPNGPYAAVIPLFIKAALTNTSPLINGDGTITRDFTPVSNVVQINTNGLLLNLDDARHYIVNVACGQTNDLNSIWGMIKNITGTKSEATYGPNRQGDIMFSLADIDFAKKELDYHLRVGLNTEMERTINYFQNNLLG